MTYGQIKFRLSKAFPGLDADLLEGWITDCYQEILGALPWVRMDVQAVLQTTAPCSTGTVATTKGQQAVTLSGGTWTAAMSGTSLRVTGDADEYQFTQTGAATGLLDRPYEGASNAAAAYTIYQAVYPVPANCRFLDEGAFSSFAAGPLRKLNSEEAQAYLATNRSCPPYPSDSPYTGAPRVWWTVMDDGSTPPQLQVRMFPIPDQVYGLPYTYLAEAPNPSGTSTILQAWIQPAALIEGTTAKIKRHLKDLPGAQAATAAAASAFSVMCAQEAYRRGPTRIEMGSYYTQGRMRRGR